MPLKDRCPPRSRQRRASSGPPVKQWNTVRSGSPVGREHVEGLGPRLAGVDHEREVVGERQLDLRREHLALRIPGRVLVVEVEAALPDRDDLGLGQQRLQALDPAGRLVGMDAGRRVHAGVRPGRLDRGP